MLFRSDSKAIFEDLGIALDSVELADLGTAKRVRITADDTTITEGAGKTDAIKARIAQIREEIENTTSDYDKEKLQERLAKLAGGIAEIRVGAATEVEMKERKALFEDALHATHCAREDGVVPGGGVALLRATSALDKVKTSCDEEKIGLDILRRALSEPCRCIAENAGYDGAVVARNILREKGAYGFNADSGEYGDMIKMGIIDPAKVTKSALSNAASVATLLLTTDCLVAAEPDDDDGDECEDCAAGGCSCGHHH